MSDVIDQFLPYLTLSAQAVYLRLWRPTHAEDQPRCAIRYADLARLTHVSLSTLKRILKKLTQRGLVQVEWQAKHVSLFTVHARSLSLSGVGFLPKEKQSRHSRERGNPALPHYPGHSVWMLACASMTDRRKPSPQKTRENRE